MTQAASTTTTGGGWRFPATFWYANGAELCERAAYYGMFISLLRYLHQDIGFTDVQAGWVVALFAAFLYFLPTFMGIMADKIGFKSALSLAFALLTAGYGLLGSFQLKWTAILSLALIMCGGAIVKPVISGTAAKCSTEANRARAMSIFYMVVNIGSFSGKFLAGYLNDALGLQYINYYAAGMSALAFLLVVSLYRNPDTAGTGKTVREALRGLVKVMGNFRFLSLILIVGGFWAIQGQLYGLMPTYMERILGPGTKPEFLANINPAVVVLLVVPITHLIRNVKSENAIGVGLLIIPFTALVIGLSPVLEGITGWSRGASLTVTICIGVGLQGLAECFLSPKFLEYASKQAPPGEVGLYLGYQHLTTFFAWLFGFIIAGYLLAFFCPDPMTLSVDERLQWREAIHDDYLFTVDELAPKDELDEMVTSSWVSAQLAAHGITGAGAVAVETGDKDLTWNVQSDGQYYRVNAYEVKEETVSNAWRNPDSPPMELTFTRAEPPKSAADGDSEAGATGEPTPGQAGAVSDAEAEGGSSRLLLPEAYSRAHYSWYVFAALGFVAFSCLLLFKAVTGAVDRKRAAEASSGGEPGGPASNGPGSDGVE
jgi:dipeptide/tripeptide permease